MKRYFKQQGVPFKEINVERDQQAARDIVRKTGQTGVPVIKIGSSWIVGFDKELARKASRAERPQVGWAPTRLVSLLGGDTSVDQAVTCLRGHPMLE